jgi:hypothetical protein
MVECKKVYGRIVTLNEISFEEQLKKGIAVEMEHLDDPAVAEKIARDHLEELPDYYDKLEKMEGGFC